MVDLIIWLIVGAAAGWIAGIVVKGAGFRAARQYHRRHLGSNCRWLHLPITGHCFSTGVDRGRRLCRDRSHHTTSCRILVKASLNAPQRAKWCSIGCLQRSSTNPTPVMTSTIRPFARPKSRPPTPWEKLVPALGAGSPDITILHVDPKTGATQLMIRSPKNYHAPKHWHTANETHTVISGTFFMRDEDGKRAELGPGSFNYMPSKMVHEAWSKPDEGNLVFITVDGP